MLSSLQHQCEGCSLQHASHTDKRVVHEFNDGYTETLPSIRQCCFSSPTFEKKSIEKYGDYSAWSCSSVNLSPATLSTGHVARFLAGRLSYVALHSVWYYEVGP